MNAAKLFAKGVKSLSVHRDPSTGNPYLVVQLRCGGHVGEGATIDDAIASAKQRNAGWLHLIEELAA